MKSENTRMTDSAGVLDRAAALRIARKWWLGVEGLVEGERFAFFHSDGLVHCLVTRELEFEGVITRVQAELDGGAFAHCLSVNQYRSSRGIATHTQPDAGYLVARSEE